MNAVGSNQTYMYTFNISGGVLAIADYLLMSPLNAAYDISILLDNVVIWHSAAVLSGTKLNYSLTTDGTVLTHHFFKNDQYMPGPGAPNYDYYPQWSFGYTFDPYSGSLNLGQYSLGQSFTLSYVMDVSAFGVGAETGALAAFGDPFSLSGGMSGSIQGGGPSPVAEPGTLLLLGTGLIYLAGIGKRHVR